MSQRILVPARGPAQVSVLGDFEALGGAVAFAGDDLAVFASPGRLSCAFPAATENSGAASPAQST